MNFSISTTKSALDIVKEFNTNIDNGLSTTVAKSLLIKYGSNDFKAEKVTGLKIFLRQFKSGFVYLLLVAALISFILKEPLDGSLVILFVLINAVLGFYQEYKSEQTVNLLKTFVKPKVRVIRNGKEEIIFGSELVPGDLVILETGDIVPADVRILKEQNVTVDESILTGESIPVKKIADALSNPAKDLYTALNIMFMGTHIISGSAVGMVLFTGKSTQMGGITKLATETVRESGFEKQLNKFSKFILYLISGTLVIVFIAHLFIRNGLSIPELALFSIAMAVGVVPEAMPLVTTFSLSHGALLLTKKKVVVKRLSAIEDLGSIEVLCSDKTGTLTENKMHVAQTFSDNPDDLKFFASLGASSQSRKGQLANNSFDLALFHSLNKEQNIELAHYKRVADIPFDPTRKRNSVLVSSGNHEILIVRGAFEALVDHIEKLSIDKISEINHWIVTEGRLGRRVIAVAVKNHEVNSSYDIDSEESDLRFLGLISFTDPVKKTTKQAVQKAKELKVAIKILTGDSPEVAGAVAFEVGIVDSPEKVITGADFDLLPSEKQHQAVEAYSVFARVSPEQKFRIIQLLEKKYQVGYLGDGINDAPALKIANVALVVEGASDIARESADIVLLSQNLEVIIDGIEEGRKTFVNTVKYIKSTLASNFGNFYAVAFASLIIDYLPMLPIQILLVNLLSDFPMISVATDTVEPTELKNPKSYEIKEIILIATILGLISTLFDFIFFGIFHKMGAGPLQTNWFIGSILTELLLIYSIRTKIPFWKATKAPSKTIIFLTAIAGILTIVIPLLPIGKEVFGFIRPTPMHYGIIALIVFSYFVTTEVTKIMYYKFAEK